jgi:drug/metabolite transporter (DMT)-like permease
MCTNRRWSFAEAGGTMRGMGVLACLVSAAAFGSLAIFGKLAYDEGAGVMTLLVVRFAAGAVLFWALAAALPASRRALRARPGRGVLLTALALGAVGYATQAGLFFAALERMDASLLALVLYTYPAWVALGAAALGRERLTAGRVGVLALASAGLVLVLAGTGGGELDALGAVLGLGAALTYTGYILVADGVVDRLPPVLLSAVVCTGAAASLLAVGAGAGALDLRLSAAAWGWLAAIAVVATVLGVALFFVGLQRVGPGVAAILSCAEPPVTVLLALLVFGEQLSPLQWAGGLLVLGAVVLLQTRAAPAASRLAEPASAVRAAA